MEFQPTPGTYAAVDPFKPSISFSIKKILGSQSAPQDDTDLNSPPPRRIAISSRRHGAIRPPTNTAVDARYEAYPDPWIPISSSRIRPPPPHELHSPSLRYYKPPSDNWIPGQASDSSIRLPPPHDFQHVQGDLQSHFNPALRINNLHLRNTSPYQDYEPRPRRRCDSRSSSPPDGNRGTRLAPVILRSSPRSGSSRVNEQLREKRNFRSQHQSRSPSPSVERNRERSPFQRHRRSRSRSNSPVRSRTRRTSRDARRSGCSIDRAPPIVTIPPSGVPELVPLPSSLSSPIIIQPSSLASRSTSLHSTRSSERSRSRSRARPFIIEPLTPKSPLPSLFSESMDSSVAVDGILLCSPTGSSQPQHPGPDFSTPNSSVLSIPSIPSPMADETDAQSSIINLPPPHEFHYSTPIGFRLPKETDTLSSRSYRRDAVSPASEHFDEKRPVGRWDSSESVHLITYVAAFALDTLPRQLYLHFLLRLPYMYFSRVTRIFEEAEMSMPQIKQGILEAAIQLKEPVQGIADAWKLEPVESVQYSKLQNTWQSFIDSLMREWKTLNIISVLLLSAILTILQIESAANDPLTRYSALLSMICALMSLVYGCIYIIRFGTMRKTYKAAEWAQESRTSRTGIFWNVWVLLAMPATWLAWSMIMYIVCIVSLIWRTGTTDDADRGPMTPKDAFAFRIIVTVVLSLGLIYFVLITSTLRRYGEMMDQAWHRRVVGWINDTVAPATYNSANNGHIPTTPVPLVYPPIPIARYQPPAGTDFRSTYNFYSTDRPYPKSKSPTIRSKFSSAGSHIPHSSSKFPLRPPTPHAGSSLSKIFQEHDHGVDEKHQVIVSQLASKDEDLSRDLKIPINASTPPLPFSPVSAPIPAHPLHSLETIPNEAYHEMVIDPRLSEVPIQIAMLLLLSFEGDHPLDVPPSEDELNAYHMTKDLWKELQTDAQQFWNPLHPENMAHTLREWNMKIFFGHGEQIALCEAFTDAESSRFALYCFSSAKALSFSEENNYSPLPEDLQRLDIFDFSPPPINTVVDGLILVTEDKRADRHGARKISLISSNRAISA